VVKVSVEWGSGESVECVQFLFEWPVLLPALCASLSETACPSTAIAARNIIAHITPSAVHLHRGRRAECPEALVGSSR
jgi:hypothetical protein